MSIESIDTFSEIWYKLMEQQEDITCQDESI